jgi:RimJ/RimL family protein N-acetyltransferase
MKLLPIENEHLPLVCEWLSRPECEWLDFGDVHNFTPITVKFLIRKKDDVYRLFAADEAPSTPLGVVALHAVSRRFKSASFWMVTGKRGFFKHVFLANVELLKIAFFDLGLESVNTWLVDGNRCSLYAMEMLGFHYVGRQRKCHVVQGQVKDRLLFDMLRCEFEETLPRMTVRGCLPGITFPGPHNIESLARKKNSRI